MHIVLKKSSLDNPIPPHLLPNLTPVSANTRSAICKRLDLRYLPWLQPQIGPHFVRRPVIHFVLENIMENLHTQFTITRTSSKARNQYSKF